MIAEGLTESAMRVLRKIAEEMSDGFSGEITIIAHQGGVRDLKVLRSYRGSDLVAQESDAKG